MSDGRHLLPAKNFTFQTDLPAANVVVPHRPTENQPPVFMHRDPVLEISRDGKASIGELLKSLVFTFEIRLGVNDRKLYSLFLEDRLIYGSIQK